MPKHQGISYFICPMDAPGIEIRPIIEMTGAHTFNEVFLTDVRLPAENLVGEVNKGWSLAKVTLGNERVSLSGGGALWGWARPAADLIDLVRDRGGVDRPAPARSAWRRCTSRGDPAADPPAHGDGAPSEARQPGAEASVRKVLADEHGQRIMAAGQGPVRHRRRMLDRRPGPLGGTTRACGTTVSCSRQALTIGGGTGDVQRNIVAERVLGLPHDIDVEQGRTWSESRRAPAPG